jgi:putative flippase GtrA
MTTRARLLRFWLVGLGGIAAQMATLYGLATVVGVHYAAATMVAVGVALVHNFLWHRAWTWMDRDLVAPLRAFARFVAANGLISIVGNVGLMWVLVGLSGMAAVPANAIAIGVCGVANFWAADRVVFGRAQGSRLRAQG